MATDQKALIKKALGRIKQLAKSKTAERFKSKAEPKAAPPPDEKLPEPELDAAEEAEPELDEETPEEDAAEADPDDIMKRTSLVIMTRAPGAKKSAPEVPPKRKPGRPRKS